MSALKLILSLVQAIPHLKAWWDELVAAYIQSQLATMRQENRDAIRDAIEKQDQRPLEKAIGNPNPGERSGLADSQLRDSLPGVSQSPRG